MSHAPREDTKPWYRQFWPWFLMALPASVVVAGITTVVIAFRGADGLVRDDYYKDGLAINQQLDKDRAAEALALSATLRLDKVVGELVIVLHQAGQKTVATEPTNQSANGPGTQGISTQAIDAQTIDTVSLELIHPTEASRDQTADCRHISQMRFVCDLQRAPLGRWYLELHSEQPRPWRLKGEQNFDHGQDLTLVPL